MKVVSSKEFRDNQATCFDKLDTIISKEYFLEPDEDLARAITMDELLERTKADIHELFNGKR